MIEIPGYRLLRPLGRGGMATVYLAVQESVQREVAIKVMSPTLLGDSQFGERFLREARIAAQLRHRHVVQVHDVAVHGEHHFIAMEYVPGGAVLHKGAPLRELRFVLRAVREIAEALDYAHSKGVVHRDIKPDNILLREDGSAALTDFGIARANDVTRMTRTGAIIGTPHYMSPEQARGQPLDGRADLYSLGIVLHELLVGRVPYEADDSLAVGIMHITAPLPRLPEGLEPLQPVVDRLLAKDPADRFQTGAELAAALAQLERDLLPAEGTASPLPPASNAVRSSPPPGGRTPTPIDDAFNEPTIGSLDGVVSTPSPRRRLARPKRSGFGWLVVAALVLLAGGAMWHYQDRLRAMLPDTRLNAVLASADRALAERRYSSAEGDGARELYGQALAIDPDNQAARAGLRAAGEGLLATARAAIARGDVAAARRDLELARELSVAAMEVDALDAEIRRHERNGVVLDALLADAAAALAAGRIDGDDGALSLYQRAHALAPDAPAVRLGREQALGRLLQDADAARAAGDEDGAAALIERVAAIDPGHLGLPAARAALGDQRRQREASLGQALDTAERLLAQGRLLAPAEGNARAAFAAVLAQDPDNARARAGLARVASALIEQAGRAAADFEFERAQGLLDQAAGIAPDSTAVAAGRKRLAESQERYRRRFAESTVDPRRDAQVTQLLKEARAAAERGQLVDPPGDSAYDKYRAVRALDQHNPAAIAGMDELPALARRQFEAARANNRLSDAYGYVEALQSLAPADPALPDMRQRLATSLLGYAAERLGAGELDRAARALDQARALEPNHAELPSLQARLEQARGG